jgi:hypothetical protein
MEVIEQAVRYAKNGWAVFPVDPGGKKPLVKWRDESTSDIQQVREMFSLVPNANIGIDTGKSGLVVIDVDDISAVKELSERFGFDPSADDTAVARTGRGGLHIYYRAGD